MEFPKLIKVRRIAIKYQYFFNTLNNSVQKVISLLEFRRRLLELPDF